MNNRSRTQDILKRYLDAKEYLRLYDEGKQKEFVLSENTLNKDEYQNRLEILRGLQYRRELVERVETSLESLMDEDALMLKLRYLDELQRDEVMNYLNYKERSYYRKLAKAESLFVQLYDYDN